MFKPTFGNQIGPSKTKDINPTHSCIYQLKQEWNDRFASSRVVGKLLLVVSMFAQSPNSHLIKANNSEDCG